MWKSYNNEWVVKEEIYSENELKELKSFCQCPRCKDDPLSLWNIHTKILDLFLHRKCATCYGCVGSDFPDSLLIKKAREVRKAKDDVNGCVVVNNK